MDCEVYIYHPCLLDRARNSQPCASCGRPSVLPSLPFGLRNLRRINAALAVAQLAPQIHKTLSPVSGLGTGMYPDPDPAIPSAVALGQKGRILFMGFPSHSPCGKSGLASLYPRHRVYLKEPKPPLNKFVEVSATTGRFCSRRHIGIWMAVITTAFVCSCKRPLPAFRAGLFPQQINPSSAMDAARLPVIANFPVFARIRLHFLSSSPLC